MKYVNIGKGEQFTPEFLAISPNNRMPAIVDPEGPGRQADLGLRSPPRSSCISAASSDSFYPADERKRVAVEEWLAWQVANVGPVFGHNNHFRNYAPEKVALRASSASATRRTGSTAC